MFILRTHRRLRTLALATLAVIAISCGSDGPTTAVPIDSGVTGQRTSNVPESFSVVGSPTAANQIWISRQPSTSAQNGVPFPQQPVLQLLDPSNRSVSQAGIVVTAAIASGGGTLGGTATAVTDASGAATFANLYISGAGATATLRFSSPGLSGGQPSIPISVSASATSAANQIWVSRQPSSTGQSGVPLATQPILQLLDPSNHGVRQAGVPVTAAIASGTGTVGGSVTVVTDTSGAARFTNLVITGGASTVTLGFSAPGLAGGQPSTAITITAATPPPATQLTITVQPSASAQSGVAFAQQPAIQLRDASNNPVNQVGVVVTASVASGEGILGGTATANTNPTGVATFTNLSISGGASTATLHFSATGLTGGLSSAITIAPPQAPATPANQIWISRQPSSTATSGAAFAQQPVVQLLDPSNHWVSQAGIPVTATLATGTGTLGGTQTVTTDSGGAARFTNLSITGVSTATLQFSSPGLSGGQPSTAIVIGASTAPTTTPTQLAVGAQPSTLAVTGAVFIQQPVIQLRDASGNAVAQSGIVVTATIATGGGVLGGTATATTNTAGVATFTNLAITGTAGARTLSFSAPSLVGVTSGVITITAAPVVATQLEIATQPSASSVSGVAFAQQPVVQLLDASNNLVGQAGVVVTAAVASGGGTLGGTATATTNAGGVATFSNLSITGGATTAALHFIATGLTGALSVSFSISAQVTAGTVASVAIAPSAATRVGGATVALAATAQDATNAPVGGQSVTWSSSNTAVATVNGSGVVTAVAPGTASITASASGHTSPAATITVVPALSGTVTDISSKPVAGGVVEIYSGATIVSTAAVSASGTYSVASLTPGSYGVMLQPTLAYSMGPAEPVQRGVAIASGQTTTATQAFTVQAALASDDFNSPAYSTAQLLGGCNSGSIPAGDFWHGPNQVMGACNAGIGTITMDPTGGNSTGPSAVRYDWAGGGTGGNLYIAPRISPIPVMSEMWVRWTSKESAGFAHGGNGAQNSSNQYKFFLIQVGTCPNGCAQFGVYLNNQAAGLGVDPTAVSIDMTDRLGNYSGQSDYNLGSSWSGKYHTWVAGMTGMGTASCTFTLYLDGVAIVSVNKAFSPGVAIGGSAGGLIMALMGANINNGPDLSQSRWFRELGIYTTRPSLRPLTP